MEGVFIGMIVASFALALFLFLRHRRRAEIQRVLQQAEPAGRLLDVMPVKGFAYVPQRDALAALLRNGEPLLLRREPDNPYDCKAVKLLRVDGSPIGYLSRRYNAIPAALLEQGQQLSGRLRLDGGEGQFRRMAVELYWEVSQ